MVFDGTSIPLFSRLLNRSLASVQHAFQNKENDLSSDSCLPRKLTMTINFRVYILPSAYEVNRSSLLLREPEQEEPHTCAFPNEEDVS